jgi:hypothetical protein
MASKGPWIKGIIARPVSLISKCPLGVGFTYQNNVLVFQEEIKK